MKRVLIYIFLLFVPCILQGTNTFRKVQLAPYQIQHSGLLRELTKIASDFSDKNIFIISVERNSYIFVWMLDKRNIMYDPEIYGYTVIGNHIFFLLENKDPSLTVRIKGSKRVFLFRNTEIPPMTDGVIEWKYKISGNKVKLVYFYGN